MAFENVELTTEERELIVARGIKNPHGSAAQIREGIKPRYLTIDKETDTWLTWCYDPREVEEDSSEFLFMYKGVSIFLQAVYIYNKSIEEICWEIARLDVPDELIEEEETIKKLIVVAFEVYKATGWPHKGRDQDKTKVICRYREGI